MDYIDEQSYNKSFSLKVWAKMVPFLKPYGGTLALLLMTQVFTAAIDTIQPLFQRYAINNFILPGSLTHLTAYILLYVLTIGLQVLNVIAFTRLAMRVDCCLGRDLKRAVFVHLQELSFSYYNKTPVGYMIARNMSDTARISGNIAWGTIDIFWAALYVAGVFIVMLILNWRLALLIMIIVPMIAAGSVYFQKKILNANREVRRINSRITGAYNEGIGGARTSKVLVIEDDNLSRFSGLTRKMYRSSVKAAMLSALFVPMIMLCGSLATAIVLARGGYMTMNGLLEFGTLTVFITYALNIFEPIQQLARMLADFISTQASIERVTDLLETKPDVVDTPEVIAKYGDSFHPKKENWEPLKGDLEFRDVTFRYPDGGENVLEHFNLKVPAGTTVAIVGETGAGKSTIINLACRFFEPTEGEILIDGRDYRERSQLWLHSGIGYVLQSPHLFSGTVRDNIRYGRLDATDAQVEEAARLVCADKVLSRMEGGYDSDVGEGGDKLSTGEKQLVSFARAILADPRFFVLDEATSSIDTETEQYIQEAIAKLLVGRTSFIVAHRLSTIRKADVILVVDDGKIIEQGTHAELLRLRGQYYDLYTRQYEKESWKNVGAR